VDGVDGVGGYGEFDHVDFREHLLELGRLGGEELLGEDVFAAEAVGLVLDRADEGVDGEGGVGDDPVEPVQQAGVAGGSFDRAVLDGRVGGGGRAQVGRFAIFLVCSTSLRVSSDSTRIRVHVSGTGSAGDETRIRVESLETLSDVEQTKKIANLPNLRPAAATDPAIKDRAIEAAAGNPRLLDWLDRIVADPTLPVDALISAIENETDRFRREDILAEKLLATQPTELQQMLAKVNVVELPIPADTVHTIHDHPDAPRHIERSVQLGLLEAGTDPETSQPRYFVSNVLRPLIRPLLTDDDYARACAAAARSLYTLWVDDSDTPPPDDTQKTHATDSTPDTRDNPPQ